MKDIKIYQIFIGIKGLRFFDRNSRYTTKLLIVDILGEKRYSMYYVDVIV
jgi:hypothetical protein